MKLFHFASKRVRYRRGFSLVEATFSIGLFSFGFLTMAPLLAMGLKTAHQARDNRATAQVAQTLIEEAKQGTLVSGTTYLDFQGNTCVPAQAAYTAQATVTASTVTSGNGSPSHLTILITPLGAPDRARTYAVVFSAPQ
jgi:uncharacterized protein (TIGR02598 family)